MSEISPSQIRSPATSPGIGITRPSLLQSSCPLWPSPIKTAPRNCFLPLTRSSEKCDLRGFSVASCASQGGGAETLPGFVFCFFQKSAKSGGSRWKSLSRFFERLFEGGSSVQPLLSPGDVLVYDARILHRGRSKLSLRGADFSLSFTAPCSTRRPRPSLRECRKRHVAFPSGVGVSLRLRRLTSAWSVRE